MERGSEVVVIGFQEIKPAGLPRASEFGFSLLSQREEVSRVGTPARVCFAGSIELLPGKFADGLQHGEARGVVLSLSGPDEALVDEGGDAVQDVNV